MTLFGTSFSRLLLVPVAALALACDGGDDGEDSGASDGTDTMDTTETGAGCGDGSGPSFAATVKPIIDANCVSGCHDPTGIWALNDLSDDPYAAMVGVPAFQDQDFNYVEPCDSANSYTFIKISGDPGNGTRAMPLDSATCTSSNYTDADACGEAPLSAGDIQTIKDWIDGGAEP